MEYFQAEIAHAYGGATKIMNNRGEPCGYPLYEFRFEVLFFFLQFFEYQSFQFFGQFGIIQNDLLSGIAALG